MVFFTTSLIRRDADQNPSKALKAFGQTDEWVDAVGGSRHAKIGPNIDLGIAVWLIEGSCSDGHNAARRVFVAERRGHFDVCGKF